MLDFYNPKFDWLLKNTDDFSGPKSPPSTPPTFSHQPPLTLPPIRNSAFGMVAGPQQINYSHPSMLSFFPLSPPNKTGFTRGQGDKPLLWGFVILGALMRFLGAHLICSF
jgi:hypothetical protein